MNKSIFIFLTLILACTKPVAGGHSETAAKIPDLLSIPAQTLKTKPDSFWESRLTADQMKICRKAGTETPGTCAYLNRHDSGLFVCACCGQPLFDGDAKFNSGTGWPSFGKALSEGSVELRPDASIEPVRTEVNCAHCGAHLGHVFDDGPPPTGKRYCMNSVCMVFKSNATKK